MNIPNACIQTTNVSSIKFEERNRSMIFENPRQTTCQKIQVDGCAITEGPRCDNLLIDSFGNEYFVELKGVTVGHGIQQILSTVPQLHHASAHVSAFVICTSCSPHFRPAIQNAKKHLQKLCGKTATLHVRERRHHHQLPQP